MVIINKEVHDNLIEYMYRRYERCSSYHFSPHTAIEKYSEKVNEM